MPEVLLALTATTALFALAKGVRPHQKYQTSQGPLVSGRDERGDDLPCPWCYGPTQEQDQKCPGCGRSFG